MRRPVTIAGYDDNCHMSHEMMEGTVVYVHPAGRYHSVAFERCGSRIIESFPGTEMVLKDDADDITVERGKGKYA
ncbi:MAG: hypothetical protein MR004_00740 [Clostridiales bacterium]|nr:hypothetical protein [Clostridiales bacterium]MDY4037635.1 hypothetical protein [Candidatus Pseudoscilispira sp.]